MSNNPRVKNVFIGGCGRDMTRIILGWTLDMDSEWIKERVSGGHVMPARPSQALGLTFNICMAGAWLHNTALQPLGHQDGAIRALDIGRTDRGHRQRMHSGRR